MADPYDPMKDPSKHVAPAKALVDKIIDLALSFGGGAVTLLSGLLAAVLIMYSGYVLYDTFATERAASSNAWDLIQLKPEIIEDSESIVDATKVLSDINQDYRAWLTVYDTQIDYPVVQGTNDTYYAAVDIYGKPSLTGAIYLAAANSPDFSDSYNVIYGHHMDSGAMFGGLDSMSGNETGLLVTKDEIYDLQFFAVISTDAYEKQVFNVGNRMNSILEFLRSGGEGGVGIGTTVTYFNETAVTDATKIVALSTCANANTSGRLVVFATMTKRVITTDVTIVKVWNDNENQDGIRPESLTVTLSNGDLAELTAENDWTATLSVPKYDIRGEITYTWSEETVNGYELSDSVYDAETKTTTITNTHIPATTSIMVKKLWADDEDRDGIRPNAVTAILSDGTQVVLNEANDWTETVENLPVYEAGKPIEYSWTEKNVDGYTLGVDGNTLTNTHEPATVTLSVRKVWNDNENQDGIRPASVVIRLYGNDDQVGSVTLDESNSWTGAISNLYVYEAGQPIAYRWEEISVEGYSLSTVTNGTLTTLTNTHKPETIDLTVSKVWDDNDNQDGIRPESLQVYLSNGSSVTLSAANSWSGTITGLPKYSDGQEIEYTWTEANVSGYVQTGSVVNGTSTVITNRHETNTTVATVIKVWDDDENRDGIRPEHITVTLSDGQEAILNEDNHWTATITGLPVNANGIAIDYTWTEDTPEGYTSVITVAGTITTLINTHEIETTDLTAAKVWSDNNDQDGIRPNSITVTLMAGEKVVTTCSLDASNDWTTTVENQPVNANGEPIVYSWTEETMTGYELTTAVSGTATTLTNSHIPATTSLTVTKVWEDNGNQDGIRPESLEIGLSNGMKVILSEKNHWTATIEDLPVCENGSKIEYSWTENEIPGYTAAMTTDGTITTITNTHAPAVTSMHVFKVWNDDNDRDALRPTTLAVRLLANGTVIRTAALNQVNGWTASFDGLPVYENGAEIKYTWEEEMVSGYELTTANDGTTTTLTNTHHPASLTLTVVKIWDDDENRDALRPDEITLTLEGDDESERKVTLTAEEDWSKSIEVPVYDRGREIGYTWHEASISRYTSSQTTEGNTTTITNTHLPATTIRTMVKAWDDADDQDGVRPDTVTVYLLANNAPIQTVLLNERNHWTYTADSLYVYENGKAVSYKWREGTVARYTISSTTASGNVTTITNAHVPEVTDLHVQKVWDDADNQDGIRPNALTVTLLANGNAVGSVELSAANNWTDSISNLPVNANGTAITYSWDEGKVEGYTAHLTSAGNTTIITNTHETAFTVATVVKIWDDDDDRDGIRPSELMMTLNTGKTVVLSEANNWTGTIENLPKYKNGDEIDYTWTEGTTDGYEQTETVRDGTVTTFTNHHEIITQDLTVVKVWDDDDNRDGLRPDFITVSMNGKESFVLSEENGWTTTLKDRPVYADKGHILIYSWSEEKVQGYQLKKNVEGTETTLTNTHIPETVTLRITKVWADSNNADGLRPASLKVTLNADGKTVEEVTLTRDTNWTASIHDLPKYAHGTVINYTWTEANVRGYTQTANITETATDGVIATTITNTHSTPHRDDTVDLTVRKEWVDDTVDGRPVALNMILLGSNGDIHVVRLTEQNNWTATVTNLPRYADGKEVQYTWLEPDIAGYQKTSVVTTGTTTVFTNAYVPTDDTVIDMPDKHESLGPVYINIGDCLE